MTPLFISFTVLYVGLLLIVSACSGHKLQSTRTLQTTNCSYTPSLHAPSPAYPDLHTQSHLFRASSLAQAHQRYDKDL